MKSHWDVIIVGTGATGAIAARYLSRAGLDILACEAGPRVHDTDLSRLVGGRAGAPATRVQPTQSRLPGFSDRVAPFFVDDIELPYRSTGATDFAWFRSRQVGGRTLTWGGVTIRLSDLDFKAGSCDGASPDWPISEADLDAHYDEVEGIIGVQGYRDGIAHVPDGQFLSPVPFTGIEHTFIDASQRRWPDRPIVHGRGVSDGPYRADDTGRAWPAGALPVLLRESLDSESTIDMATDTIVRSLVTDPRTGEVVGVSVIDRVSHEQRELRADAIVLCASTIESTRILLNSRSGHHPHGIGNSSDVLGRFLMDHPAITLTGSAPRTGEESPHVPPGGPRGFYVPRFRNLPGNCHGDFLRGYQMWGHAGRSESETPGTSRFMLAICGEMLPHPENRVTLHDSAVDRWGVPIPIIHFEYGSNERALMIDALDQARQMLEEADFTLESLDAHYEKIGSYVHEVGTARMGSASTDSVVDPWNRVWDAPNVLVVDGACWPTSGNQNPTLTMMAIAHRACEGLLRRIT